MSPGTQDAQASSRDRNTRCTDGQVRGILTYDLQETSSRYAICRRLGETAVLNKRGWHLVWGVFAPAMYITIQMHLHFPFFNSMYYLAHFLGEEIKAQES